MDPRGFDRKPTAMFSADVVGHSRLMQDVEANTVNSLATYKQIISDLRKNIVDELWISREIIS